MSSGCPNVSTGQLLTYGNLLPNPDRLMVFPFVAELVRDPLQADPADHLTAIVPLSYLCELRFLTHLVQFLFILHLLHQNSYCLDMDISECL